MSIGRTICISTWTRVHGATFGQVLETALAVRSGLSELKIPSYPKTSGSRGIHIYVPIRRGPTQKQVWGFAKELARDLAARFPELITAEYRIAKRPAKHVLVDYNQNAWGRTLASVYSVRPKPRRDGFNAGWLGRDRARDQRSRISGSTTFRNACEETAISSIRCCWSGGAYDWSNSCEIADRHSLSTDGS